MRIVADILCSLFVIVVLVPALAGAIIMGCWEGRPRKEQE